MTESEANPVPSKDLLPPAYVSKINGIISIEIITCHIHMRKGDIFFTVDFAVHNELMNVLQMQMNQQRKARFQTKEIIAMKVLCAALKFGGFFSLV